jgi:hypothetical protein
VRIYKLEIGAENEEQVYRVTEADLVPYREDEDDLSERERDNA